MCGPGSTVGHPPERPPSPHAAQPRLPEGDGTPWMGPHPAKRAAPAGSTRCDHAC